MAAAAAVAAAAVELVARRRKRGSDGVDMRCLDEKSGFVVDVGAAQSQTRIREHCFTTPGRASKAGCEWLSRVSRLGGSCGLRICLETTGVTARLSGRWRIQYVCDECGADVPVPWLLARRLWKRFQWCGAWLVRAA